MKIVVTAHPSVTKRQSKCATLKIPRGSTTVTTPRIVDHLCFHALIVLELALALLGR